MSIWELAEGTENSAYKRPIVFKVYKNNKTSPTLTWAQHVLYLPTEICRNDCRISPFSSQTAILYQHSTEHQSDLALRMEHSFWTALKHALFTMASRKSSSNSFRLFSEHWQAICTWRHPTRRNPKCPYFASVCFKDLACLIFLISLYKYTVPQTWWRIYSGL